MEQRQAAVVGGSLGGLLAANLLMRAGWDVHVYERVAEELEGRGAGIVTHPELMEALQAAHVPSDQTVGVSVEERITLGQDGSVLARMTAPQVLTAWGRLYRMLKAPFPAGRYHAGHMLETFEQDEAKVHLRFTNGFATKVDLLVAADGLRSTVRQALLPRVKPSYAGYIAWRGLVEESVLGERARRDVFPYFAFGVPPHEQMIGYPVAGKDDATDPGKRRFNFVWYRPADEATTLRDLMTDDSGRFWPDGIPPPLIRPVHVEAARAAARAVLAPQFAEVVEMTANLFFQPIFDLESPRMAFGRIALLGDAAFVARPHCGMGVTKAGGDALALLRALTAATTVAQALDTYDRERREFGSFIVGHARALGAYMQAQLKTPAEQAMAERYRTPETVMRETAMPPGRH